jgi:hypothetical protein
VVQHKGVTYEDGKEAAEIGLVAGVTPRVDHFAASFSAKQLVLGGGTDHGTQALGRHSSRILASRASSVNLACGVIS